MRSVRNVLDKTVTTKNTSKHQWTNAKPSQPNTPHIQNDGGVDSLLRRSVVHADHDKYVIRVVREKRASALEDLRVTRKC